MREVRTVNEMRGAGSDVRGAVRAVRGEASRRVGVLVAAVATLVVVALLAGGAATASSAGARVAAKPRLTGSISVSAAASLTAAFTTMGADFQRRHPGTTVAFNFGSSATLVTQIQAGAPADVLASADLSTMDKLVQSGAVSVSPTNFARNQLEIAVKPGNPEHVRSLGDLADVRTVALCGATVPCGIYAANVLQRAHLSIPESSITRGADAKATLAAVSTGDADAALVYVTDVKAAGRSVQGVVIPDAQNTVAVYPIAPLASSGNPAVAKAFTGYVTSAAGRRTLARFGFLAP